MTAALRSIPVTYTMVTTLDITVAERDVVDTLCRKGHVIDAIKFIRAQYGLGLKEAKDIVDSLRNRPEF